ncbi:4-galactosyl-N-acetylglucosaminide 3-alpha-L-fucosyltransferase 9-like isoform X1 [Styela clava]
MIYEDNNKVTSTKCKVITCLAVFVTLLEISMVKRWESMYSSTSFSTSDDHKKWMNYDSYKERLIGKNATEFEADTKSSLNVDYRSKNLSFPLNHISQPPLAIFSKIYNEITKASTETASYDLRSELSRRLKTAKNKKVILIWIPMFGVKTPYSVDEEKCGKCEVTYDRAKIVDENTGALLFHFDAISSKNMPPTRNTKHLYIYWDFESTATLRNVRGHSLQFEESLPFNATFTYRRDSDFYGSYEGKRLISDTLQENKLTFDQLLALKTKFGIAIVSNCGYTPGARRRLNLLNDIMKLNSRVDGYGACFKGGKFYKGSKLWEEVRKYKFYFSYENSYHCKDYITEKFFNNAINSLTVPVVWGAKKEDYAAVAPLGSFIFAEDFNSSEELIAYLNYLDQNDTAYMEYLRWVNMAPSEMPQYNRARGFCQICRALHGINIDDMYNPKYDPSNPKRPMFTNSVSPRTVDHLSQWFYEEDNSECFNK